VAKTQWCWSLSSRASKMMGEWGVLSAPLFLLLLQVMMLNSSARLLKRGCQRTRYVDYAVISSISENRGMH
jgi:hypothetical protein